MNPMVENYFMENYMFCNHAPKRHAVPKEPPKPVKKKHPNIVAIFEKTYKVYMRTSDTVTIKEQRTFGKLRTGDKYLDEALENELTTVLLTINDMVEYYKEGISFHLANEEDAKSIYEAVQAHTGEWRDALRYAYNMGDAPIEDLIHMENFTATIYQHAKFSYEKRPEFNAATGTLAAFLYSKNALPGITYINNNRTEARDESGERRNVKELKYEPNIDVFKNALMQQIGIGRQ